MPFNKKNMPKALKSSQSSKTGSNNIKQNNNDSNNNTAFTPSTGMQIPIQTICLSIDEQNKDKNNNDFNNTRNILNLSDNNNNNNHNLNNNIINIVTTNNNKWRKLKCLPDIFSSIDLNTKHGLDGNYNFYKSNIYGKYKLDFKQEFFFTVVVLVCEKTQQLVGEMMLFVPIICVLQLRVVNMYLALSIYIYLIL